MKAVIAQFVEDIKADEDTAGHSDSKTTDIDERVAQVTAHVAQSYFEIIFNHGWLTTRVIVRIQETKHNASILA
jgi:hypothetical protein